MAARYPLKRFGTPAEAAALAAFLLSPASDWITGQVLAREMYDHQRDPGEMRNVIAEPPSAADLAEATVWMKRVFPHEVPPAKR